MRIKINLEYVLQKNNMSLEKFLEEVSITSYAQLLEHCEENNFNPVTEAAFNSAYTPKKEKVVDESPKKDTAKKNTRRATSGTQNKKRGRPRTKKV